jgi:hypothetical protein
MHVYHYGNYENAAIKQLMGTYATRENEVDDFLRRGVFVNLHTVVARAARRRRELLAEQVEALVPYVRRADVREGIGAVLATSDGWSGATRKSSLRSPTTTRTIAGDARAPRLAVDKHRRRAVGGAA